MNNESKRLREAFDEVHAEQALKDSAIAFVAQAREAGKPRRFAALRMAAAACCALLLFFAGYGTRRYFEPVSVISIDINPSIELGVNAFDRVVSVEAYNEDGQRLADSLELRFQTSEEAVSRIVDSEMVSQLLAREEQLVITVVDEDEARSEDLCLRLEEQVGQSEQTHCHSAKPAQVAQAHKCGLSYGKYLAAQEALAQNEELTTEEIQDMTIKELEELTGETECQETTSGHSHGKKKHKGNHHN